MDKDKHYLRQLKKLVKKAGNKRRRQFLKRNLADNPEEAPYSEFDFGPDSSAGFNGMDKDSTRRRNKKSPE